MIVEIISWGQKMILKSEIIIFVKEIKL